ncbi:MAG TPA: hypothetical protein VIS49_04425, partial [Cyclobacteriaceae bacterium]
HDYLHRFSFCCRYECVMSARERNKGLMSSKGYFKRAKTFGVMMLIAGVGMIIYYLLNLLFCG